MLVKPMVCEANQPANCDFRDEFKQSREYRFYARCLSRRADHWTKSQITELHDLSTTELFLSILRDNHARLVFRKFCAKFSILYQKFNIGFEKTTKNVRMLNNTLYLGAKRYCLDVDANRFVVLYILYIKCFSEYRVEDNFP